ncbi:hypothetical protein [Chryseobacterium sp. SL1]|uniref:hypothetical protein n=1 Tax=Chryseobacterium sp. SL1 TaxID=2995159 RepID=UPI002274BD76|nr:hypothetical protein [Chryseobacterium sp. SL1]MCY1661151.1 hypothetical protein [Chryseobacterium sp. SL1]
MITLEQLTEELDFNKIDEVVGGTQPGKRNTWWDAVTTYGGTSFQMDGEGDTLSDTTPY